MNSKLYRCGWCGYPTDEEGHPLKDENLKKATKIINNYELGIHQHLVNGWCCPNGNEPEDNRMVQITRDMASDACDPSLEGQWMRW